MSDKPNKPGSEFDDDGKDQAVKNQSTVTPDDYPDTHGDKPDTKADRQDRSTHEP